MNVKAAQTADVVVEASPIVALACREYGEMALFHSRHTANNMVVTFCFLSPSIGRPWFLVRQLQKESEFQRLDYATGRCFQRSRSADFTVSIARSTRVERNSRRLLACNDSHSGPARPSRNRWKESLPVMVPSCSKNSDSVLRSWPAGHRLSSIAPSRVLKKFT